MRLAVLSLLLSSCGPVLLSEEPLENAGRWGDDAGPEPDALPPSDAATDSGMSPSVLVRVAPVQCGRCFELHARGVGGHPPYEFQWEDGTAGAERIVCADGLTIAVSVTVRDASALRSTPQLIHLQGHLDEQCAPPTPPPEPSPRPRACLQNGSFEGTPAANFGQGTFDAAPWSACSPVGVNMPDIGNEMVAQTLGPIPQPTDGLTYVALGEGEQVSQAFCSPLPEDGPVSFELDLARIDIGAGLVPETEQVFLEVWAGLSVDCSRREWLWASPALQVGWQHYCFTVRPSPFMTQLFLRAMADMTQTSPAHLLIDNLKPVDSCP